MPATVKAFTAGALLVWCVDRRAAFRREWEFAKQDVRDLRSELVHHFGGSR